MANFFTIVFFWVILSGNIQTILYFISFFNKNLYNINNGICLYVCFFELLKLIYKLIYDTFLDLSNGIG
jgi:hypothetical protein